MDFPDDFSPVVEQGDFEPTPGLFGRIKRRRELPAIGVGFQLVLVGQDGALITVGEQLSAGERRFAGARSWVKVDVGEHVLGYRVSFFDPTGRYGLVGVLTIGCAVISASEVAARAIASVKGVIEPVLGESVLSVTSQIEPSANSDPIAALNESRRTAERALRETLLDDVEDMPDWLTASVKAVTVGFDESTETHLRGLVGHSRDTELDAAIALRESEEAKHTIALRAKWRKALGPHLADPTSRAVEMALDDPSAENIANVVRYLDGTEEALRVKIFHVLNSLIDKEHLHKTSELPAAMEAIMDSLQRPSPALGEGKKQPTPIDAAVEDVSGEHEEPGNEAGPHGDRPDS